MCTYGRELDKELNIKLLKSSSVNMQGMRVRGNDLAGNGKTTAWMNAAVDST